MSTIIADADGLIKLGKCGALPALLSAARVLVPQPVWEEAVEDGKRGMHEDAHVLERTLTARPGAEVVGAGPAPGEADSFGAGERAALAAFRERGADAVLTDDRAFVGLLAGLDPPVPVLVPAAAVVELAAGGHLTLGEAGEALDALRPLIRDDVHEAAQEELGVMERAKEQER